MGLCASTFDEQIKTIERIEADNKKLCKKIKKLRAEIKERDQELEQYLNNHDLLIASMRAQTNCTGNKWAV